MARTDSGMEQSCLQVCTGEVMGDAPTSFPVPSCEQLGAS